MKRGAVAIAVAAIAFGFGTSPIKASAQEYPNRSIRMIVGYAPGGTTDILARQLAIPLGQALGQSVIVENRPGGATRLSSVALKNARPDGYTLLLAGSSITANTLLYRDVQYRMEDFQPISLLIRTPYAFSVSRTVGTTLEEYLRNARAAEGRYFFATLGTGGTAHLIGERFRRLAGLSISDVAYNGSGPALIALSAGEVQSYFDSIPSSLAQYRAERIRILAVTSEERLPAAPDLPTFRELGFPAMTIYGWFGLLAPAGTPQPIVERLNIAVRGVFADAAFRASLEAAAMIPSPNSPTEFATAMRDDVEMWREVIAPLNIQLD